MRRQHIAPRADWRQTAEAHGFSFHSPGDTVYWDESHFYDFSLAEIECGLEAPAAELDGMCLDIVGEAVRNCEIMSRLRIPEPFWDYVARSWEQREPALYGRMDFAFDGAGPAKLYEYNADTPTSLYEASVFQWIWLEQMRLARRLPAAADQFNALHEKLIGRFAVLGVTGRLHLAAAGQSLEDMGTIDYLAECARQAGLATQTLGIESIGIDDRGRFTDGDDRVIDALFKLYPWEWLLGEDFARHIPGSRCRFIEPAWKTILSNKGVMALLWETYPGHPNLLPAYFESDPRAADLGAQYVRKPLLSREGANVEIVLSTPPGAVTKTVTSPGPYGAEGHILQAWHPLPRFQGRRPVCGVWLVGGEAVGLGMREGDGDVTTDAARFVPHAITH